MTPSPAAPAGLDQLPVRSLTLDDLPACGELAAWLRAHGLTGDFVGTLMVHTAPDIPGDVTLRFAPYSVALG